MSMQIQTAPGRKRDYILNSRKIFRFLTKQFYLKFQKDLQSSSLENRDEKRSKSKIEFCVIFF